MSRWEISQKKELECWASNERKINTPAYLEAKRQFWHEAISLAEPYLTLSDLETKSVLEFGCGPSGVFLLVKKNSDYHCLDPLMDDYIRQFPFINKNLHIHSMKLEDFDPQRKFDLILGFNSLDHVDDIDKAIERIKELAGPKSIIVLSLNVHSKVFLQWLLEHTNAIFDRLHKHQYTAEQYRKMIEKHDLEVLKIFSLDGVEKNLEERLASGQEAPRSSAGFKIPSPGKLLFGFLKLMGLPRHGFEDAAGRGVYNQKCFVLTPRA